MLDSDSAEDLVDEAKIKQQLADSISVQNKINAIDKYYWKDLLNYLDKEHDLSFKDKGILKTAGMGKQNLSVKQCFVLERILNKYQEEFKSHMLEGKDSLVDWLWISRAC